MDSIMPSAVTYKVNALVNGVSIDKYSLISSEDAIQPCFEESVSNDPDVTALMVYLRNSEGKTAGEVFIYALEKGEKPDKPISDSEKQEKEQYDSTVEVSDEVSTENKNEDAVSTESEKKDEVLTGNKNENNDVVPAEGENEDEILVESEGSNSIINKGVGAVSEKKPQPQETYYYRDGNDIIIPVQDFDTLPSLPLSRMSKSMPIGRYTLVFQVMSEKTSLYKTEKIFYYLGEADFSLKGINVYLPGIAEDTQLVPLNTVIMLEAKLNFDARLEPYFIWYNGKKIISEGSYSDGGGNLLLKTPDQNGFFPVSVEVFPIINRHGLTGYSQGLSLPVSSKAPEMHLLSIDVPQLLYWYVFEGDLTDSIKPKRTAAEDRVISPVEKINPRWLPAGGTYGLLSGWNEAYTLPAASLPNNGTESRQFIFRFMPVSEGVLFNVQFGPSFDVTMSLSMESANLVLTLATPLKSVSQTFGLTYLEPDVFVTACVDFSIWPDFVAAELNVMGYSNEQEEPDVKPIAIAAKLDGKIKTTLGIHLENKEAASNPQADQKAEIENTMRKPILTALWDEFALLNMPPMEVEFPKEEPEGEII
jgi:hypothetical protein